MKSKIIKFFIVAGFLTATVTSCYKSDFDDLQKQVDELEDKVAQNAKDIQDQITSIETTIASLQQQDADFGQELQGLVSDLQQVSDEVEANANSVYYGNLVTDEDYAAYKDAGADVVTGYAVVSNAEQAQIISNCRWVGENLVLKVGNVTGVQNVGGDVLFETEDTEINLAGLQSVGGNFKIPSNKTIVSLKADDLKVLTGELRLDEGANALQTISMNSLEFVGTLYLNNRNVRYNAPAVLDTINLNNANVVGDMELHYLVNLNSAAGKNFSIGSVGRHITIQFCNFETFNYNGAEINGNLLVSFSGIKILNATNVENINGNIDIDKNFVTSWSGSLLGGLEQLNFNALKTINGNLTIRENRALPEIFNTVETVNGDIVFVGGGYDLDVIAFEKLTNIAGTINLYGALKSLQGFNSITALTSYKQKINLGVVMVDLEDNSYRIEGEFLVTGDLDIFNNLKSTKGVIFVNAAYGGCKKFGDSFTSLTNASTVSLYFYNGTQVWQNAFSALTYLKRLNIYAEPNAKGDDVLNPLDFSVAFNSLSSVKYANLYLFGNAKFVGGVTGLNISEIGYVYSYNATLLSMPELTTVSNLSIKSPNLDINNVLTLDFPKLATIKYNFKIFSEGENPVFNVAMPELNSCKNLYIDADSKITEFNAPLAKLSKIPTLSFSSAVDVSNSFKGLTEVTSLSLHFEKAGVDFPDDVLPKLNKLDNLLISSLRNDLSVNVDNLFSKVSSISGNFKVNSKLETGVNVTLSGNVLKVLENVSVSNIKEITANVIDSISGTLSLDTYGYDLTADFTNLKSIGKLYVKTVTGDCAIDINMPVVTSCEDVKFYFPAYKPSSVTASLPLLKKVNKLTINFKSGIVDATNMLTGLTSLIDDAAAYVKLTYHTGQKYCNLSTLLPSVEASKLSLYKDGSSTPLPDEQEAAEITELTTCN